ncbi:MAG: ABC transporter permease [Pseudorhodoplanes sp.]
MLRLLVERLLLGIVILLGVSVIVFVITMILPGDVAQAILEQGAAGVDLNELREQLGLNQPAPLRYFGWLGNLLTGNFGKSLATGRDISALVAERLPYTLALAGWTALIAVPISVMLGLLTATFQGSWLDRSISSSAIVLLSAPEFLFGTFLVIVFAVKLRWLPAISFSSEPVSAYDYLRGLTLPVATLVAACFASLCRMSRSAILGVLASPAIEVAILKGLPRRRVIWRHALPNALPPIITVIALNLAYMIGGVVVVEVVFNYPGLGKLLVDAVAYRDVPLVQFCAMFFCLAYVLLNLMADVLALLANPRRRYPK